MLDKNEHSPRPNDMSIFVNLYIKEIALFNSIRGLCYFRNFSI
jgi:hypothetical protein